VKKNFSLLLLLFAAALLRPPPARCAPADEEQHVRNFYSWYISEAINSDPAGNDDIYKYVCRSTMDEVRFGFKQGYFDADYFTKSQDIWLEWLDSMVVHPAVMLDEAISIIPVSFTLGKDTRHHLVVFMRNDADALCITKVSGAQHFWE
jgi:hypothetical protein